MTDLLPPEVRTPRLLLRRQRPADAPLIRDAIDASLRHLQSSVAWAREEPSTLAALTERLARSAAAFDAGQAWAFTVLDAAGTRVLGGVGIEPAEPALIKLVGQDAVESGYWLRVDATGCGYASEAVAALTEVAFFQLGVSRVAISHDPANIPSAGVPRRLGFRCLGTFPQSQLPGRRAADGSIRPASTVWVLDAPAASSLR